MTGSTRSATAGGRGDGAGAGTGSAKFSRSSRSSTAGCDPTAVLLLADREACDHEPGDDEGSGNAGRPDREVGEPGQGPDDHECDDEHAEDATTATSGTAGSGT